jgi:hypothetical protein
LINLLCWFEIDALDLINNVNLMKDNKIIIQCIRDHYCLSCAKQNTWSQTFSDFFNNQNAKHIENPNTNASIHFYDKVDVSSVSKFKNPTGTFSYYEPKINSWKKCDIVLDNLINNAITSNIENVTYKINTTEYKLHVPSLIQYNLHTNKHRFLRNNENKIAMYKDNHNVWKPYPNNTRIYINELFKNNVMGQIIIGKNKYIIDPMMKKQKNTNIPLRGIFA